MTFLNYGRPVSRSPVLFCRDHAIIDAFIVHEDEVDTPMGREDHNYGADWAAGTVVLSLTPSPRMTWGVWRAAVTGLGEFWDDFRTVEMMYWVRRSGEDVMLGTGYLALLRT